MEHIIQFGVTVDDDLIRKRIIEQASETVVKETKKELGVDRSYYSEENVIRRLVEKEVTLLFDKHKDAIVEEAGKQLANKLVRTKAVKERTSEILDTVLGGGDNESD
ncbi:hypothetical protein G4926_03460 [Anaerostipes hadrus]|uniref:hypothetical protein n=1 Tax=Anaerostipes hadrus TaxID=649756 RepID=UPI00156E5CE1|nr:hypothetical protein [Anaerostipes hadrus]NSG75571.1 hypothetical protein [Anaerostipes hadrus]